MALIAVAENAHDVASALSKFLDPVAEYSADIAELIAELFNTIAALRKLDAARKNPIYFRRRGHIAEDVETVTCSLIYSFKDVQKILGGLGKATIVPGGAYRQVWRELTVHFKNESNNSLCRRLFLYQQFLWDLTHRLVEG